MIFAEDEEEFYSPLKEMQAEAISLGYEEIFALDMENAVAREKARWETVKEYQQKES